MKNKSVAETFRALDTERSALRKTGTARTDSDIVREQFDLIPQLKRERLDKFCLTLKMAFIKDTMDTIKGFGWVVCQDNTERQTFTHKDRKHVVLTLCKKTDKFSIRIADFEILRPQKFEFLRTGLQMFSEGKLG